jgi:hypothetical protein
MAALSSALPTLLDVTKRMDPNGTIADVGEVLQKYNEILDDIGWKEGSLPTGEQITIRTNKPTPTFRLLNAGVVPNKSTSGQVVETCAIMEDRSHVDVDVANLNGDAMAFRASEDVAIIQAMSDTLATTLIYGDTSVDPEQFNGLAARYFSLTSTHVTYANIIDAGGTGSDNTSIWLCCWSPQTLYGIFPKGSKAGLVQIDEGIQTLLVNSTTGAYMRAYVTFFQWKCGFAIKDWRSVVRICNIDISDLETASDSSDTSANILKFMSQALDKLPPNMSGRKVFYMNERVRSMLRVKMLNKSNLLLRMDELKAAGTVPRPDGVLTFLGVPCRRIDAILNTETQIT